MIEIIHRLHRLYALHQYEEWLGENQAEGEITSSTGTV
jgi:hypothetical protein